MPAFMTPTGRTSGSRPAVNHSSPHVVYADSTLRKRLGEFASFAAAAAAARSHGPQAAIVGAFPSLAAAAAVARSHDPNAAIVELYGEHAPAQARSTPAKPVQNHRPTTPVLHSRADLLSAADHLTLATRLTKAREKVAATRKQIVEMTRQLGHGFRGPDAVRMDLRREKLRSEERVLSYEIERLEHRLKLHDQAADLKLFQKLTS